MFFAQIVFAEEYKVLVLPDNIVTETAAIDSAIYDQSAEFFADGVITILNGTDFIKSPQVSETRELYKQDSSVMLAAKSLMSRYSKSYNVDYAAVKKLAVKSNVRYVLLLTSYIDAENYILRRTLWDFLNIPGATVVDPAYKISTYAVLVDTNRNLVVWSDTYYKTISVVENRIITRGLSPQTEQLAKIRDYSRYLCPQIAQHVQLNVLPPNVLAKESKQIDYDMGNIDNVFTKKYRHYGKESGKFFREKKAQTQEFVSEKKQKRIEKKARKAAEKQQKTELKVKATPVNTEVKTDYEPEIKKINYVKEEVTSTTKTSKSKYNIKSTDTQLDGIEIKKTRKNTLFEIDDSDRPKLRDYD